MAHEPSSSRNGRFFVAIGTVVVVALLCTVAGVFAYLDQAPARSHRQTRVAFEKLAAENASVSAEQAEKVVDGQPKRTESTVGQQRVIHFQWKSFFAHHELRLYLSSENLMVAFEEYQSPGKMTRRTLHQHQVTADSQKRTAELKAKALANRQQTKPPRVVNEIAAARRAAEEERVRPKRGFNPGDRTTVGVSVRDITVGKSAMAAYGTMPRELIRQAFLMSAEHQLGLHTIDISLGEQPPADDAAAERFPFEMLVTVNADAGGKEFTVDIEIMQRTRGVEPFRQSIPQFSVPQNHWLESLAERMEQLSRKEFVQLLEQRGYQSSAHKAARPSDASTADQFDVISQFAAARQLHAALDAEPTSTDLLERLARTYAHLGILTESHWAPTSKIFKSRALLYAQRLLNTEDATPRSLSCRAYTRALTGLHRTAMDDLIKARDIDETRMPSWTGAIQSFCEYDFPGLEQNVDEAPQLPAYLSFHMSEPNYNLQQAEQSLERFLKLNPACQQAVEKTCRFPMGAHRAAVSAGFTAVWQANYPRFTTIPELPAAVMTLAKQQSEASWQSPEDVIHEMAVRRQLIDTLRKADDDHSTSKPSWNVLGELLHDQAFLQAWSTVNLEANILAVPVDDTLKELQPLMQDHRYKELLNGFVADQAAANQSLATVAKSADDEFLEQPAYPLIQKVRGNLGPTAHVRLESRVSGHVDLIDPDLNGRMVYFGDLNELTTWSYAVSPSRPGSVVRMISERWAEVQPQLAGWEEKFRRVPALLRTLSQAYRRGGRPADAHRVLEQLVALEPTRQSYAALYGLYAAEEDETGKEATLKKMLTFPSYGLEAAETAFYLAQLYMNRGDWQQAEPYAREAAESYSGWGMACLTHYAEGTGDWKLAEALEQARSERYRDESAMWWAWCERTGRGEKALARQLAEAYWSQLQPPYSESDIWWRGVSRLADDDIAGARAILDEGYRQLAMEHIPDDLGILTALLAEATGDVSLRDKRFGNVALQWEPDSFYGEFVNLLQCFLREGDQARWNEASFDRLVLHAPPPQVTLLYYFAGKFLTDRNQTELGHRYLMTAATSSMSSSPAGLLATLELRKHHVPIGDRRLYNIENDLLSIRIMLRKNYWAANAKDWATADRLFAEMAMLRSDYVPVLLERASTLIVADRHPEAVTLLERVIALDARCSTAYQKLATLLATSDDPQVRDGAKAIAQATKMEETRAYLGWEHYQIQATAYAEAGEFPKAIELQQRVLKMKPKAPFAKKQLEFFRQSKPWRMQQVQDDIN